MFRFSTEGGGVQGLFSNGRENFFAEKLSHGEKFLSTFKLENMIAINTLREFPGGVGNIFAGETSGSISRGGWFSDKG